MIVLEKRYHFYAAHRNQHLQDKCRNIHGHTYYVTTYFSFDQPDNSGITVLFSDVDRKVEPLIKALDHALLLDVNDPIYQVLRDQDILIRTFDVPTSVENLCQYLYNSIRNITGLPLTRIDIQETTTSIVRYEP